MPAQVDRDRADQRGQQKCGEHRDDDEPEQDEEPDDEVGHDTDEQEPPRPTPCGDEDPGHVAAPSPRCGGRPPGHAARPADAWLVIHAVLPSPFHEGPQA